MFRIKCSDALHVQIVHRTKDIAKVAPAKWKFEEYYGIFVFWPIICLVREFTVIVAVCSILRKPYLKSNIYY